ncbi:hypothetical protein RZS08_33875, partial [Arthrospira platensis SPKY1]|nr:hypothetical protein [Arthrospira platensis SPKY1]
MEKIGAVKVSSRRSRFLGLPMGILVSKAPSIWSWVILSAALLLVMPAGASGGISLEEALALAADTHPTVALRIREREATEMSLEATRWQRYPNILLQAERNASGRYVTTARVEQ